MSGVIKGAKAAKICLHTTWAQSRYIWDRAVIGQVLLGIGTPVPLGAAMTLLAINHEGKPSW